MATKQKRPLWELTRHTMRGAVSSPAGQFGTAYEPHGQMIRLGMVREPDKWMADSGEARKPVYKTYKDRVFRMLFKDKKRLLELYNALNGTEYTDEEELTVNTLENAVYLKMKNDISFIIDYDMYLYEHQSTYCPNMPLRGLLYFADLYKKFVGDTNLATNRRIRIPTPHYVVFYNGLERQEEEFVQYLSDSFEDGSGGCIELTVKTININYGHNQELLDRCPTLSGYACFVAKVRENMKVVNLPDAVAKAVEECISEGILKDFFTEQKSEVVAMSIYDYDEESVLRDYYEDGREHAMVEMVEAAMKNMGLDLETACKGLDISPDEYKLAKSRQVFF